MGGIVLCCRRIRTDGVETESTAKVTDVGGRRWRQRRVFTILISPPVTVPPGLKNQQVDCRRDGRREVRGANACLRGTRGEADFSSGKGKLIDRTLAEGRTIRIEMGRGIHVRSGVGATTQAMDAGTIVRDCQCGGNRHRRITRIRRHPRLNGV